MAVFICLTVGEAGAGNIWIDGMGTSSTSGTWDSGIRSDTETSIYPPYVKRWEKYEWRGEGKNVVPAYNFALIYDGYVYFGEGNHKPDYESWAEPGYVWAWDVATGVTKTGYPLGPLDSGIMSAGGGIVIAQDKLYALTNHYVWAWDIGVEDPQVINGYPVYITETADGHAWTDNGLIFYNNKIFFATTTADVVNAYVYALDAASGGEAWKK
ncbi:MAG TPA: hypothetical protein ENN43_08860, partial [bacterium]|nr:hypothetical protein [bacterium]